MRADSRAVLGDSMARLELTGNGKVLQALARLAYGGIEHFVSAVPVADAVLPVAADDEDAGIAPFC